MREHFDSALKFTQSRAPGTFDMWFSQIQLEDFTDGVLTLRAKNTFAREWVTNAFLTTLTSKLRDETGLSIQVNWVIGEVEKPLASAPLSDEPAPSSRIMYHPSRPAPPSSPQPPASQAPASVRPTIGGAIPAATLVSVLVPDPAPRMPPPAVAAPTGLNPKFTFENFIVGPSNQLAHAAALAVTGDGGKRYNPLFLCGSTGLGKSHLVHAIAHRIHAERPDRRILYVTAERFTNEYVEALQNRKMEDFRRLYRNGCDVLLIDDVHSLAGRTQTQEEFFHTFNALYSLDRTIVMTSDAYPQKLDRMEERLVTRFAWGLVADIQPPDLETRVAIVRKKAIAEGVFIDDEVAVQLAQALRSSIRELEGMVIRLAAKSSLTRQPVDMDFARSELQLVQATRPRITSIDDVQRLVCHHFQLRSSDLLSKDRSQSVAKARHIAMYLCKHTLDVSYPEIGRAFGRDHTTVMSAVKKVIDLRERDAQIRAHLDELERKAENGPTFEVVVIQRRAATLSLSLPVWVALGACAGGAANHTDTSASAANEVTVASATASSRSSSPSSQSSSTSAASPSASSASSASVSSKPGSPKSPPVVTGSAPCDAYIAKLRACAREIEPEVMAGMRPVTEAHIASLTLQINAARDPKNGPPAVQRTQVESIEASCMSMLAGLPATCVR